MDLSCYYYSVPPSDLLHNEKLMIKSNTIIQNCKTKLGKMKWELEAENESVHDFQT